VTKRRSRRRAIPWGWIGAGLVAVVLFVLGRLLPLQDWLVALQDRVARMGALGALVFGAAYVVAVLLFVPGSVLTIGAGLLFGFWRGLLIVSLASTTAAAAGFLIARYLARERVERLARRNEKFGAIDRAIRQKGWQVVVLLRLSPVVPYSLSNYLYGLTAVDFGPYLLASWLGMLPGTALYVSLGAAGRATAGAGRSSGRSPGEWALLAAGIVATVVVTVVLTRAARRELEKGQVGAKT
jgi:uncharacterized membrane protein YdjX (TVP38/TMEM64 family)